jgi:hypothetical protein
MKIVKVRWAPLSPRFNVRTPPPGLSVVLLRISYPLTPPSLIGHVLAAPFHF